MENFIIDEPEKAHTDNPESGFGFRLVAYLYDLIPPIVMLIVVAIMLVIINYANISEDASYLIIIPAYMLFFVSYHVYFDSSWRQGTPGKQRLGLIITNKQGEKLPIEKCLIRYFIKFLFINIYVIALLIVLIFRKNILFTYIIVEGYVYIIIFQLIDYLTIFITKRRQALHDIIAGSLVTLEPEGEY